LRYALPNQSSFDFGLTDDILDQSAKPDLDHFVSATFEEVSRQYI